jgi:peptide deformylase
VFAIPSKERLMIYGPEMVNIEAAPVFSDEYDLLPALRRYMLPIMRKNNGIGLAAPQIGVFKQYFLMMSDDGRIVDVVNPEITRMYGFERLGFEACLSLPPNGNGCKVARCEHVDIEFSTSKTPLRSIKTFSFMDSRVAQHEFDHLTGTFFVDRIHPARRKEVLEEFHRWKGQSYAEKLA